MSLADATLGGSTGNPNIASFNQRRGSPGLQVLAPGLKSAAGHDNIRSAVRYGFNREHNHPGVLWSGVYYVQAPANSGRLVIREPRRESTMIQPRFRDDQPRKKEVWGEVYYEPVPGRIIIFPGWLEHAVEPNLSTRKGTAGERISIAFNLTQGFKTG